MTPDRRARAGAPGAGGVRGGEVDATEAVHVQVDETRHCRPAPPAGDPDGGDPVVDDLDVPTHEQSVDDRRLDAQPQRALPPCTGCTGR